MINETAVEKEQVNIPAYKVYSELLKKPFDTVDELVAAEQEFRDQELQRQKKSEERKNRAGEVEQALKDLELAKREARDILVEANKRANEKIRAAEAKYEELRKNFAKDYGNFHLSYYYNDGDEKVTISDLVTSVWNNFPWMM